MKSTFRWWRIAAPILIGVIALLMWAFVVWRIESKLLAADLERGGAAAIRRVMLPTPREIGHAALDDGGILMEASANTFLAALIGFLAASLGGYLLALGLSLARILKWAFYPWVLVIQMTPLVVVAPIIAIWIQRPALAPVVLVTFLLGFFPVVANALQGFSTVPRRFEDLFAICGARPVQTFWHLRVPHSLPAWFTGMKIAATLSPAGAIFADLFVGSIDRAPGLGFQILIYKNNLNTPGLFAAAILACLMGFLFVGTVRFLRVLCLRRWPDSPHSGGR